VFGPKFRPGRVVFWQLLTTKQEVEMTRRKRTEAETNNITTLLRSGLSHGEVARRTGWSQSTVSNVAKQEGIENVNPAPSTALRAKRDYDKANRREVGNLLFDRIVEIATSCEDARGIKDCAVAYGVVLDKFRLEDNEPDNITEQRASKLNLEEEFRKIDQQLAEELKDKEH
jgi:hypothetical protein